MHKSDRLEYVLHVWPNYKSRKRATYNFAPIRTCGEGSAAKLRMLLKAAGYSVELVERKESTETTNKILHKT